MRFTWSDAKRKLNIEQHGLDFVDAPRVFDGPTYTYEDDRFDYSEQRFVTPGILHEFGSPVPTLYREPIRFRHFARREQLVHAPITASRMRA